MSEDGFKLPKLSEGSVSVVKVHRKNGRILNDDDTYYEDGQLLPEEGGKTYYNIYRSYDEAKNDIFLTLENNLSYEYIIYSHNGDELDWITPPREENIKKEYTPTKNIIVKLWEKYFGANK